MTTDKHDETSSAAEHGKAFSRRTFLAGLGGVGVGAILAGGGSALWLKNDVFAIPVSGGYLLIDSHKCGTCTTCMMACTIAHTGKTNLNFSRIQIGYNPLGRFPYDSVQHQCHQCPYPPCVEACPTQANHADKATGVRMVDPDKCIGCERCINACPYLPSRCQWNYEEKHSQKCDLCIDTPFWDQDGGPGGHQACVDACPMRAISFTVDTPEQKESGYDVNLRNTHWAWAGFPIDDQGRTLPSVSVPGPPKPAAQ
ncbi:MAG: 4Fe-4S dicluster domain-containing protein [Coriobacteriia bacterium]|nr:4Fe-4S dicluster domain-containing protein [Coriobacteriia bacterium]